MTTATQGSGRLREGSLRNAVWQVLDSTQFLLPDEVLGRLPRHYRHKSVSAALSKMYGQRHLLEREARIDYRKRTVYAYRKRPVHSWSVAVERALVFAWTCPRCGRDRFTQRHLGEATPKIMRCEDCDIVVRVQTITERGQG